LRCYTRGLAAEQQGRRTHYEDPVHLHSDLLISAPIIAEGFYAAAELQVNRGRASCKVVE
jgi:hypothetical protein